MKCADFIGSSLLVLCLVAASSSLAQVSSSFDVDLDGWRISGDNSAVWQTLGGNPGGCLDVNDLAIGEGNWAIAPRKFLGDWSAFTSADTIFFDIYELNTSGGEWNIGHHVIIEGPGGAAWADAPEVPAPPPTGVWLRGRISFDPACWTIISGNWESLIANITSVRILAELVVGEEETWLDNIRLSSSPSAIFNPCLENTFNVAGTGDWSFENTAGVSNPGSGGNGAGFLQISDKTTGVNSYGFAPPVFLGDWSLMDGNGLLTVDIRILSGSGPNGGSPDFIRLSGPGGVAHVSLSASDLTIPPRVWKTFAFPINEAQWTLDSGSWAPLLDNVTECRLDLEYIDGTEIIGMDNFGRRLFGCSRIDDAVEIHDSSIARCDIFNLVGISTVAINPMDGELYGLVRATSGGLCRVSGNQAGIFIQTYDTPSHLIFTPAGDAFISQDYYGYVYRKAWGGGSSIWVSGFHDGDDDPYGLTIAPPGFDGPNVNPGDVLVSDRGYNGPDQIWSFSPSIAEGELLLMPDPGEVEHFDMAAAKSETVYVSDCLDPTRLYILNDQGALESFAIDPPVTNICSIVYDSLLDDLYIASMSAKTVYRVNPISGNTDLIASGFSSFDYCCLEIDAAHRRLYVSDKGYNRVYEFCIEEATAVKEIAPDKSPLLFSAFPNPFNPAVSITFMLDQSSEVRLGVYNVAGRLINTLYAGKMDAGTQMLSWNGRDSSDNIVSAGIYFLRLNAAGITETQKIVLVR